MQLVDPDPESRTAPIWTRGGTHLVLALLTCSTSAIAGGCTQDATQDSAGLDDAGSETGDGETGDGETGDDETGDGDDCLGEGDFDSEVQPIFSQSCALSGCHAGASPAQGMSLEPGAAYGSLVAVASAQVPSMIRVEPGDPAGSLLMNKLGASPAFGQQMPPGGELSQSEIDTIEAWIAAGAPETEAFMACDGDGVAQIEIEAPETVEVGMLAGLTATALDSGGQPVPDVSVVWTSARGEVLFVDRKGTALGVSPGVVEVVASIGTVESDPVAVEVVDFDPPAAAFLAEVEPILSDTCAVMGCHVDGVEPGDLRFDRSPDRVWEELAEPSFQVPSMRRVEPGAPLDSYLMVKLVQREPPVGGQMPLGTAPIDAESAQTILRWILADAPFD